MITTNNPEALGKKYNYEPGISTKENEQGQTEVTEWPDTLPPLTQALVDQAEAEYIDTSAEKELLKNTDSDLSRILEDAMAYLKTAHNIDIEANLSTESRAKLKSRRDARTVLKK